MVIEEKAIEKPDIIANKTALDNNNKISQLDLNTIEKNDNSNSVNNQSTKTIITYDPSDDVQNKRKQKSMNFIFAILKEAKDDSENPVKFLHNFYQIVSNSVFFIFATFFISILPLAMIIIGFVYRQSCPIQPNIPVWLIVTGIFGLINGLSRLVTSSFVYFKNRKEVKTKYKEPGYFTCLYCLVAFFLSIWFFIGNGWVYSIFNQVNFDSNISGNYCNYVLYYFAFWSITFIWILIVTFILFFTSLILFFAISLIYNWLASRKL